MMCRIAAALLIAAGSFGCASSSDDSNQDDWTPYEWTFATTLDASENKLNIAVFDFNTCRSAVNETQQSIRVRITCAPDSYCDEPCGLNLVRVRTKMPVGDRKVIDATTGTEHVLCEAPKLSLNEKTQECEGGLGGGGPR